jgi:Fibronectin type III-like domain
VSLHCGVARRADPRHTDLAIAGDVEAGGSFVTTVRLTNTGPREGSDVVQLYGHDVVASITRPTAQLLGYRGLGLESGESAVVRFVVPTTRLGFSDRDLVRAVEPGDVELWVGPSCESRETETCLRITGQTHQVTVDDPRWTTSGLFPA